MSNIGPQQFEIPISDQLYVTMNPNDPIIGIASSAHVPVTIPWNQNRTDLAKDENQEDKKIVFDEAKWSGAGTGPHDVFEWQMGGQRVKIGTISWSMKTEVYRDWLQQAGLKRLRITPCPVLTRTFTPLHGSPDATVVAKNPQPCYGKWVPV